MYSGHWDNSQRIVSEQLFVQWSVFLAFTVASFPADAGESPFMPFPCLSLQDLVIKQQRMEESCP